MVKRGKRTRYHASRKHEDTVVGSDDDQFPDPSNEDMLKDEIDEFHLQQEKILLDHRFPSQNEEDEEEVLPLDASSSDESSNEEFAADDVDMTSDIEDKEDDVLDPKAWGKKKSMYYATDYVDEDFGGFEGADAEAAEMEEKEALALQQRLIEQLDEADFDLGLFTQETPKPSEEMTALTEKVKKDFSELSKKEKLELIKIESPELLELIEEFKDKLSAVKLKWLTLKQLVEEKKIPEGPAADYITIKCHIILNYCINISYYMMLKASRQVDQSHPVIRRLKNYYNLLKKTSPLDDMLQPQINAILKQMETTGTYIPITIAKKPQKKVKFLPHENLEENLETDVAGEMEMQMIATEETMGTDKRGINYQIAKNKGLTPHRKKEQRNPRVKHRMKYKKAKVRRKGQIREPRTELVRYGGEISGIKANVTKSIKLR